MTSHLLRKWNWRCLGRTILIYPFSQCEHGSSDWSSVCFWLSWTNFFTSDLLLSSYRRWPDRLSRCTSVEWWRPGSPTRNSVPWSSTRAHSTWRYASKEAVTPRFLLRSHYAVPKLAEIWSLRTYPEHQFSASVGLVLDAGACAHQCFCRVWQRLWKRRSRGSADHHSTQYSNVL